MGERFGTFLRDVPVKNWLAIIFIVIVVFKSSYFYITSAQPPKISISPANFVGEVVIGTNKDNLRLRIGLTDRGVITETTRLILSEGLNQVAVLYGEKVLTQTTILVDKKPIKKVEAFPENPLFLRIEINTNDQVAAVFVNQQKADGKDGVFTISFPLWTIWNWEEESLSFRIEDQEGNGGAYPPIPLSTYLPPERLELRDPNGKLWGIAQNKPFWWDFLSTFKVQTYIGKELVSNNVITWEQTALLVVAVAILLVGIMFIVRRIELVD